MRYLLFIFLLLPAIAAAKSEADYVQENCSGQIEVVLQDRTRVDCLTDTYAIEFDYCPKWAEAIGQSLHYALMTGKQPAIALICNIEDELQHIIRIWPLADQLGIRLWLVEK